MTKLFDMIPNSFFNYLGSGSNNRIYAECLMLIYSEYENEISYVSVARTAVLESPSQNAIILSGGKHYGQKKKLQLE